MGNKKVEIKVKANSKESIFICGNIKSLGEWDVSKAQEMKKDIDGFFKITKMLPEKQIIEFKFLRKKDWAYVEKGAYDEEVKNHLLILPTDEEIIYEVEKFNK